MKNHRVVVADLGSTHVCALVAESSPEGRVSVLSAANVACDAVRDGKIVDRDQAKTALDAALKDLSERSGPLPDALFLTIGGGDVSYVRSQGLCPIVPPDRPITRDDVLKVINHSRQVRLDEGMVEVQAVPCAFAVDGAGDIRQPVGVAGSKLEVKSILVAYPEEGIDALESVASGVGREIEQIVARPLCSGLAVLTPEQIESGAVVIDIGGDLTEFAVFRNGALSGAGRVPLGGKVVTSDVAKLLKTSFEEAENLKIRFGSAIPSAVSDRESIDVLQLGQIQRRPMQRKVFCEIISSRVSEIAKLAKAALESSGLLIEPVGTVVLTGGGSLLPGVDKAFGEVFAKTRVAVQDPWPASEALRPFKAARFSPAFGAARFALECCDEELSTATESDGWRGRIRTFLSSIGSR